MWFFNRVRPLKDARRLTGSSFSELVSQLQTGEELVGQYDHGLHVEVVKLDARLYTVRVEEEQQGVLGILGYWARPV